MPAQDEIELCEEAQTALTQGNLHKAADLCKSLLVRFPGSARGYHLTASIFRATGNYRKARDYSSIAAELDTRVVQYHLQQGQMLYLLKEYADAEVVFLRAIAIAPHDAEVCRSLGNCLAAVERFEEAKSWFARARDVSPQLDMRLEEAECDMQAGDNESAEKTLTQYVADHPRDGTALTAMGKLAISYGEFMRAEALLRKAIALDGSQVQAHFYLALILAEAGEEERGAIEHLLLALTIEPTHLPSLLMLGGIFMKSGDFQAGEKAFTHVIALAPDHLLAWYSLLEIMQQAGRVREGLARLSEMIATLSGETSLRHLRALFSGDVPPMAAREFVIAFYSSFTDMFEPWVVVASDAPHAQDFAAELRNLPQLKGKRYLSLLDLGCGTGVIAKRLSNILAISAGVDITPAMLRLARRSKHYDVLYDLDIVDYVTGSESIFDVVVATGALRWIGNLQPFFQGVRGVMHAESILACMLDKEHSSLAYSVANHGRYSHHYSYVMDVAQAEGLQLVLHKEWSSGPEADEQIIRHMFFFKKMTVH